MRRAKKRPLSRASGTIDGVVARVRWSALPVAFALLAATVLTSCDSGGPGRAGATGATGAASTTPATVAVAQAGDATVTSITDGDTVRVHLASGADERVRLIGIDTPETHDPRTVVECFGREAAAQTASLLPVGTAVRLQPDVEPRDRYGRLLAYVFRADDGLFVNETLVAGGWAVPYRYPPNVEHADEFSALGAEARRQGLGLWGACGGADAPASSSASKATPAPVGAPGSGACDPNYTGACVPELAADLDCRDIGVHGFQVVGADPHRFDGNGDGIACEQR